MFEFNRKVADAERDLNIIIREIINHGGHVYLVDKSNKDCMVRLDREFNISYFVPVNMDKIGE